MGGPPTAAAATSGARGSVWPNEPLEPLRARVWSVALAELSVSVVRAGGGYEISPKHEPSCFISLYF